MGIRDIPAPGRTSARLLDAYEREHFGFDLGGRTVAEATLALLATFPPNDRLPVGARPADLLRHDGRRAARRLRLPAPVPRDARRWSGARSRPAAGWSGSCRRAPSRTSPGSSRRSRSYPDGYRVGRARHVPARLPGAPPAGGGTSRPPRRVPESSPERDVAVSLFRGYGPAFRQRCRSGRGGGQRWARTTSLARSCLPAGLPDSRPPRPLGRHGARAGDEPARTRPARTRRPPPQPGPGPAAVLLTPPGVAAAPS